MHSPEFVIYCESLIADMRGLSESKSQCTLENFAARVIFFKEYYLAFPVKGFNDPKDQGNKFTLRRVLISTFAAAYILQK